MAGLNCCCPCVGVCDGTFNTKSTMRFTIGGLHAQFLEKPIRNYFPNAPGISHCNACPPPSTDYGDPGPVTLATLNSATCCLKFGMTSIPGEGISAEVNEVRELVYDVNVHSTGSAPNGCTGGAPFLTSANNIDIHERLSVAMAARRKLNLVDVTFCPSTNATTGAREWTVTVDVCFRVVQRWRTSLEAVSTFDCWKHVETSPCADPTPLKLCVNCCFPGGATSTPVAGSCASTITEGTYEPSAVTVSGDQCTSGAISDPSYNQYLFNTYFRTQRRIIKIPRDCALPSSLTLTASDISGAVGDSALGWEFDPVETCWYDAFGVWTGDTFDIVAYEPMTEDWTIALT